MELEKLLGSRTMYSARSVDFRGLLSESFLNSLIPSIGGELLGVKFQVSCLLLVDFSKNHETVGMRWVEKT